MFSRRLPWHHATNAIQQAVEARRACGASLLDLTVSNPTAVGFVPSPELIEALVSGAQQTYRPDPRGSQEARAALASWLRGHGARDTDPDELFLTSSTSEAYGWILKLMCDPGDRVVRFAPTYPLIDHLSALEGAILETIEMEPGRSRWQLPLGQAEKEVLSTARAAIVVHPNNPTGHFLSPEEVEALSTDLARADAALIADEVFFEQTTSERRRIAIDSRCLTFSLGGLSKTAALPHWKLGWIRVTGPASSKRAAIEALELIADTYLPVSSPVQSALPAILEHTDAIRASVMTRILRNLEIVDEVLAPQPAMRRDSWEGGWSAVLRVPVLESEERLVLDLISSGVLVHPGYFYDFPAPGRIVVSLLAEPEVIARGMRIVKGSSMTSEL